MSVTRQDITRLLLDHRVEVADGPVEVEGMVLAKVKDCDIVALACPEPCHGIHPRYRVAAKKLAQAAGVATQVAETCKRCGGSGWLDRGTQEAGQAASFALTVGMYRGVVLDFTGIDRKSRREMLLSSFVGAR